MGEKRVATNSMLATGRRCREKYAWRYVDGLAPAKTSKAPSFGSLFHELVRGLWNGGEQFTPVAAVERWRSQIIEDAKTHAEQVKATLGIADEGIVVSAEEQAAKIAGECLPLFTFYRDTVWAHERDRFEAVFVEQNFNVPMLTRDQRRHPVWRLQGKLDLVLRDKSNGQVVVRDYKTTVRQPTDMAMLLEIDTQPVMYFFASLYLATHRGVDARDQPQWPEGLPGASAFELEIIRKKVPQEPPLLKRGGLSKAQNIDTTAELFRRAIDRHGLDPADYADILERLEKRGPAFHYRHRVAVGPDELERWMTETRFVLEDLRRVELHRDESYRADSMVCRNQYGRLCEYHALCYGDREMAMADFVRKAPHVELSEDEEVNGD